MGSHQVCELGRTSEGMEDLTGGLAITFKLKEENLENLIKFFN